MFTSLRGKRVRHGDWEAGYPRRVCERLVVSPAISNHQKSRLWKADWLWSDEGSRSEAASDRSGSGVSSKRAHLTGRDSRKIRADSSWVFKGNNGTR